MNATSSGVASSAAKIRSPSFSRSSSSMTTTALPALMSAIARSIGSRCSASLIPAGLEQAGHVLGEDIDLEVHRFARLLAAQSGRTQGPRDQTHLEPVRADRSDRQRDAVDRDRPLLGDE